MTNSVKETESKPNTNEVKPDEVKTEDEKLDDYGYEKTPKEDEPKPDEKKDEEQTESTTGYKKEEVSEEESDEDKIKDPATGYNKEETTEEDPAKDEDPAEVSEEDKTKKEIDEVVKELPESLDKDKLVKFALDNKFNKDQVQAYISLVKDNESAAVKHQANQVKAQRAAWNKELMTDPEFGGELFDKNIHKAEKVLDKFLPNMKKVLTERKTMLPPYIMKDLLGLSKVLDPTTDLVGGDPGKPKPKEKNFLEEMYE